MLHYTESIYSALHSPGAFTLARREHSGAEIHSYVTLRAAKSLCIPQTYANNERKTLGDSEGIRMALLGMRTSIQRNFITLQQ